MPKGGMNSHIWVGPTIVLCSNMTEMGLYNCKFFVWTDHSGLSIEEGAPGFNSIPHLYYRNNPEHRFPHNEGEKKHTYIIHVADCVYMHYMLMHSFTFLALDLPFYHGLWSHIFKYTSISVHASQSHNQSCGTQFYWNQTLIFQAGLFIDKGVKTTIASAADPREYLCLDNSARWVCVWMYANLILQNL